MVEFTNFTEDTTRNNVIIQRMLREVDMEFLSTAMLGFDEEIREMILRNMSKRAAALLKEDMASKEGNVSKHAVESCGKGILQKLRNHDKYYDQDPHTPEVSIPEIDLSSEEAIIETFKALVMLVRKRDVLALEEIEDKIDHPVMRKGIEMVLDGWDSLLVQSILENYKETYLRKTETELDMILEGIDSLIAGHHPPVIEAKLRSRSPGLLRD